MIRSRPTGPTCERDPLKVQLRTFSTSALSLISLEILHFRNDAEILEKGSTSRRFALFFGFARKSARLIGSRSVFYYIKKVGNSESVTPSRSHRVGRLRDSRWTVSSQHPVTKRHKRSRDYASVLFLPRTRTAREPPNRARHASSAEACPRRRFRVARRTIGCAIESRSSLFRTRVPYFDACDADTRFVRGRVHAAGARRNPRYRRDVAQDEVRRHRRVRRCHACRGGGDRD